MKRTYEVIRLLSIIDRSLYHIYQEDKNHDLDKTRIDIIVNCWI